MSMTERLRDYATSADCCGYTVAFAAWELGVSASAVHKANHELLRLSIVKEIAPKVGREGAVYAYNPDIPAHKPLPSNVSRLFPELDESRRVGELAPRRGEVVPHTRAQGNAGKEMANRKKQARGVKIRGRNARVGRGAKK